MGLKAGRRTGSLGRGALIAVLMGSACAGAIGATLVAAHAQAARQVSFDIPAGPLSAALAVFGRQSGLQVTYLPAVASGKRSNGLSGRASPHEALARILQGSGLTYRFTNAGTVAISAASAGNGGAVSADGTLVLETIDVQGRIESAWGPVEGIVAQRSATGTKTDTPLLDVPGAVSVVTADETERRGAKNLDQTLAYTPGVNTNLYGADKRYDFLAIRGFDETRNGIYRDGLQNRLGNFAGARVEPYGMERIEVMKGSTSTLYGLNSPGGLVNMITKRPTPYKFGEVYTTFGDGHIETGTDFGGPLDAAGDWSYRVTAKWQDGKDGHSWARDDRVYIAPSITWKPTDATSFIVLADYNKRRGANRHGIPLGSGIDPETFLGEPEFDKNDTEEFNLSYIFDHDFGNGLKFHSNARYTNLTLAHESVFATSNRPMETSRAAMAVDGQLSRFAIDNHVQYDASVGRFDTRTLFGVDYSRTSSKERDRRGTAPGVVDLRNPIYCGRSCISLPTTYNNTGDEQTVGAYLQEELTFDDRWILTLGARYDDVRINATQAIGSFKWLDQDIHEDALTKRAGLTFKATEEVSIYGTYSQSFVPMAPGIGRLLFEGFGTTPKPMRGTLYEAGIKYRPTGMNALFTAAIFDLTQTNVPYQISTYEYGQIGQIGTRGVELEAKAGLTDRLNLTLAYSYLDAKIEKFYDIDGGGGLLDGKRPQFIPDHTVSAWLDYTIPGNGTIGDLTLGVGARFVGSRYADNANTVKLDPYVVFDAALNYQISQRASLAVNVTNLFDNKYISHIETFPIDPIPDTAFYGDRRTIRATLKTTW